MGRVYQQTFIDTYSKVGFAKLYERKTPITAADLLNDRVIPLFDEHDVALRRVLTDRGTEYCGKRTADAGARFRACRTLDRAHPPLQFSLLDGHRGVLGMVGPAVVG